MFFGNQYPVAGLVSQKGRTNTSCKYMLMISRMRTLRLMLADSLTWLVLLCLTSNWLLIAGLLPCKLGYHLPTEVLMVWVYMLVHCLTGD